MTTKPSMRPAGDSFIRRHRTFFVGLFVLVPLVVVPSMLMYTLAKSEFFQEWHQLHVFYDQTYGLGNGNQVTISGMPIGHVVKVALVREGYVDVTFQITKRYLPFVKKDSRALLKQKNLVVGDWEIQLTGGSDQATVAGKNDTLVAAYSLRIDKLTEQITGMIAQVDSIIRQIASGKGAVGKLLGDDALVTQTEVLLRNVNGIAVRSMAMMSRVDSLLGSLNSVGASSVTLVDSVKTMMSGVRKTLDDAQVIVANVKGVSVQFAPLASQVQSSLDQAETMMRGLQKNWLIRTAIGKPKDKMLKENP
jgi:phospholipid/cholesterol/gamma-HCH transport system substrate-binding protein